MPEKKASTYYKDPEAMKLAGGKIREIRLSKRVTIEEFANECGVDTSQIGRMELGKVNFSVSYLFRIARALEIQPRELIPLIELLLSTKVDSNNSW